MRFALTVITLALLAMSFPSAAEQRGGRAAAILERFHHANQWRDHIMVVGHRGGVRENGEIVRAENSLEAIEAAVELGVEAVEIDVQKTRDGVSVALHDSWLDRTTTCKGRLLDRTLADLATCRLKVAETGRITNETVPTLKAILSAARDRVLVNIDNKMEFAELKGIAAEARSLGMEEQIIVKQNLWNAAKVAEARELRAELGATVQFMPIIADDAVRDASFVRSAADAVGADAVELINWRREAGGLTGNGGALFRPKVRAQAVRGNWHMWVNTYAIVNKSAGFLAGGRGDQLAVQASSPDEVFGFWVEQGVTIIQTDEPKAAIDWLQAHGYRQPYDLPEVSARVNLGG